MSYAPLQSVTLTTDDNEEICFVLVSDKVDLVSLNPLKYKHTLTCSQNTRLLSKHIVRNSVISQTPRTQKIAYTPFLSRRTSDSDITNTLYAHPNFAYYPFYTREVVGFPDGESCVIDRNEKSLNVISVDTSTADGQTVAIDTAMASAVPGFSGIKSISNTLVNKIIDSFSGDEN